MNWLSRHTLGLIPSTGLAQPAAADVIVDWNEKVVAFTVARGLGPRNRSACRQWCTWPCRRRQRRRATLSALVDSSSVRRQGGVLSRPPNRLAGIDWANAPEVEQDLVAYSARNPDNAEKQEGIKLGETARPDVRAFQ